MSIAMIRHCTLFFLLALLASCSGVQKALKLQQKRDFWKAESVQQKLLEKDSSNFAAWYARSVLYADTAFSAFQVDSSFTALNTAIQYYDSTDSVTRTRLVKKHDITRGSLRTQRQRVDSLAFVRAKTANTVNAYQDFINRFTGAQQTDSAIALRNARAFDFALNLDTYQGYKSFMNQYPDARQYPEAEERYNALVFEETVSTGSLQSFIDFLNAFPDSPFRTRAEKEIFEMATAGNDLDQYSWFIENYPNSPFTPLAFNLLFYQFTRNQSAEAFLYSNNRFPIELVDSLRRELNRRPGHLYPFMEDNLFGFMNVRGEPVIPARYTGVEQEVLCRGVSENYVLVEQEEKGKPVTHLLSTTGQQIYRFDAGKQVEKLGAGLLAVHHGSSTGMILLSGHDLINPSSGTEELDLLPVVRNDGSERYAYLAYREKGKWGIRALNGRVLLKPAYDAIYSSGSFIIVEQGLKLAVTNVEEIASLANRDNSLYLSFLYDDTDLLSPDYLQVMNGQTEGILRTDLSYEIPLERHAIVRQLSNFVLGTDYWLVKQQSGNYRLYSASGKSPEDTYLDASFNGRWMALRNDQKQYALFDLEEMPVKNSITYDSLRILNSDFVELFDFSSPDSVGILFSNRKQINFPVGGGASPFKVLRTVSTSRSDSSFLVYSGEKEKAVYDRLGNELLSIRCDEITMPAPGYFVVKRKGKEGMYDAQGKKVLNIRYDGIANYRNESLAVLSGNRFGLYDCREQTFIQPAYDALLQVTRTRTSSFYVARERGRLGFITADSEELTPYLFTDTRAWNDTSAWVEYEDQWHLLNLKEAPGGRNTEDYLDAALLLEEINSIQVFAEHDAEQLMLIGTGEGYGLVSNRRGLLYRPTLDDIQVIGDLAGNNFLYSLEKYVSEAELHVMIYENSQGEQVFKNAYTPNQYDRLYCDD